MVKQIVVLSNDVTDIILNNSDIKTRYNCIVILITLLGQKKSMLSSWRANYSETVKVVNVYVSS